MKLVLKSGILLLFFFCPNLSFCQGNPLAGYVVTNTGDTLRGFIDYKNWDRNPTRVRFKNTLSNNYLTYSPSLISSFSVAGEYYVSGITEIDKSPHRKLELNQFSRRQVEVDTVFLNLVVKGNVSLFHLKDENAKDHYLIQKRDSVIEELIYHRYYKNVGSKRVIHSDLTYKSQLNNYLSDCPDIKREILEVDYRSNELVKLFERYNRCVGEIHYIKAREKLTVEAGVLAGLTSTNVDFGGGFFPYLVRADFGYSTKPTLGLFFEVILPRDQKRWSLNNDIVFKTYQLSAVYDNRVGVSTSTFFDFSYLKLSNMLRYQLIVGELGAFVNVGFGHSWLLKSETSRTTRYFSVDGLVLRSEYDKALNRVASYEGTFLGGAGITKRGMRLEFRYEQGTGMSDFASLSSKTRSFSILFGLEFSSLLKKAK